MTRAHWIVLALAVMFVPGLFAEKYSQCRELSFEYQPSFLVLHRATGTGREAVFRSVRHDAGQMH